MVSFQHSSAAEAPAPAYHMDDHVMVRTDREVARLVPVRDVVAISSSANYTLLWLKDASRLIVRRTLKTWEEQLPADFMRVHRTTLINLHAFQSAAHRDRQVTHVFVRGVAEPVRARRELWPTIEQRLTGLTRQAERS
jgi:DNA-binding LytR/AlgR family response regulator